MPSDILFMQQIDKLSALKKLIKLLFFIYPVNHMRFCAPGSPQALNVSGFQ